MLCRYQYVGLLFDTYLCKHRSFPIPVSAPCCCHEHDLRNRHILHARYYRKIRQTEDYALDCTGLRGFYHGLYDYDWIGEADNCNSMDCCCLCDSIQSLLRLWMGRLPLAIWTGGQLLHIPILMEDTDIFLTDCPSAISPYWWRCWVTWRVVVFVHHCLRRWDRS